MKINRSIFKSDDDIYNEAIESRKKWNKYWVNLTQYERAKKCLELNNDQAMSTAGADSIKDWINKFEPVR